MAGAFYPIGTVGPRGMDVSPFMQGQRNWLDWQQGQDRLAQQAEQFQQEMGFRRDTAGDDTRLAELQLKERALGRESGERVALEGLKQREGESLRDFGLREKGQKLSDLRTRERMHEDKTQFEYSKTRDELADKRYDQQREDILTEKRETEEQNDAVVGAVNITQTEILPKYADAFARQFGDASSPAAVMQITKAAEREIAQRFQDDPDAMRAALDKVLEWESQQYARDDIAFEREGREAELEAKRRMQDRMIYNSTLNRLEGLDELLMEAEEYGDEATAERVRAHMQRLERSLDVVESRLGLTEGKAATPSAAPAPQEPSTPSKPQETSNDDYWRLRELRQQASDAWEAYREYSKQGSEAQAAEWKRTYDELERVIREEFPGEAA